MPAAGTSRDADYKTTGSVGFPAKSGDGSEGKKQLSNGMYRQHRILSDEEVQQGKKTRWTELEIHGQLSNLLIFTQTC